MISLTSLNELILKLLDIALGTQSSVLTKCDIITPPKDPMTYYVGRLVPEILELIDAAADVESQTKIIKGYINDRAFVVLMGLWLNGEWDDFSDVVYPTHLLPNGLAPQTLSNNLNRIIMLTKKSGVDKKTKDKIFANILHSVNQNEVDFLIALVKGDLNTLYPNVDKETIKNSL
jgi:hypothetical protein